MTLVDSNIIIYAINTSSPKHKIGQQFLQEKQKTLVLSQQNIFESIRVLTHPKFPSPMKSLDAVDAVGRIARILNIIAPVYETAFVAMELIKRHGLVADRIFDAYLVATMLTNDITEIATDNEKDLTLFQGITVVNPFKVSDN